MKISVVVPFYNEEGNVDFVLQEVLGVLRTLGKPFEIIAVDDASKDRTPELLKKAASENPQLRIITHPKNFGQAAGFWSGFEAMTGDVVITLDGDRQNDFRDIPRLLPLLDQYDAVMGQRMHRRDPLSKRVASRIAYGVRNFFLQDGIRDSACSLKIMKKKTLQYLIPIEGFYRMIPFLLKEAGVSIVTAEVNHRPRCAGQSKYSLLKLYFLSTIMDLFFMWWYKKRNFFRIRRAALSEGSRK